MITCNICAKTCSNTFAYVRHMRAHSFLPNASFKCGFPECTRTFSKFSAFKCHTYGHKYGKNRTELDSLGDLTCHIDLCNFKCEDIRGLLLHLKRHFTEGKTVTCPFKHCDKKFTVKSTFTAHVSRKHKDCSKESLVDSIANSISSEESEMQHGGPSQASYEEMEIYPEKADEEQFLKNVALFYLKLQAKLLLPSTLSF